MLMMSIHRSAPFCSSKTSTASNRSALAPPRNADELNCPGKDENAGAGLGHCRQRGTRAWRITEVRSPRVVSGGVATKPGGVLPPHDIIGGVDFAVAVVVASQDGRDVIHNACQQLRAARDAVGKHQVAI